MYTPVHCVELLVLLGPCLGHPFGLVVGLKLRGAFSDALLRVGLTCLPVVVDSLKAILLQCSVWVFPASCGTLPSLSRLRSPTSHLFNLSVLVGGYLDRAYLLLVPESHCPPKDYSSVHRSAARSDNPG